ncbi:MAG: DUF4430 domain-containing protein [Lachnospiraceae bacterium]|nr:DUF4430 domain-containing protein [Lachnospiraceae bacterium]
MKMTQMSKISHKLSFILCMMLVAATTLIMTGCNDKATQEVTPGTSVSVESNVLGEGDTKFTLSVVDQDGNETQFEIHTDKETVGEALLECGLVEGDEGEFGLYVKKVNGIEADYDKNGTYWAFYINGEYATTGVDSTTITEGDTYSLKVEK